MIEKVFDAQRLDLLFGRDRSMVDEIVEIILADYPVTVTKLEQAIDSGDIEEIRNTSHTLKGSLGNVGGNQPSKTARYINEAAKQGDVGTCRDAFKIFSREITQFFTELRAYRESLEP